MAVIWKGLKVGFAFVLILTLLVASTVLAYLLYDKYKSWGDRALAAPPEPVATAAPNGVPVATPGAALPPASRPASARIEAPVINQYPELPAGCEVTSLAMLFAFAGIEKSKMELYGEMPKDPTPVVWGKNGTPKFWGNPNKGYVGDATRKGLGFGIYHDGLFPLAQTYMPTAVDLSRKSFDELEAHLAGGVPIVVWTTIDFKLPQNWIIWDSNDGQVKTTFKEHAVLLVGYDEKYVYVNNPANGQANQRIDKSQFIDTWVAMGRQGISYLK